MKNTVLLVLICSLCACKANSVDLQVIPNDTINNTSTATLLFVGDFMQHLTQIEAAQTDSGYNYDDCWKYIREEVSKADVAIGNFETTLGGKPYGGYPNFCAPDEFFTSLVDAGFDIFLTCNNHSLDTGRRGVERTILRMKEDSNVAQVGTYLGQDDRDKRYPYIFETNGIRIALLNYTYGTNGLVETPPLIVNRIDTAVMAKDILRAKAASPDAIIACMHWGIEYVQQLNDEQKYLAEWLLEHGVDHVIGSHPHVVQPLEMRVDTTSGKQHLVAYSLGNYISNMKVRATDGGMMLRIVLEKDSTVRIADCAYSLVYTARPVKSGKRNFQLIPAACPREEYAPAVREGLHIFLDDTRKLLRDCNVREYSF